MSGGNRHRSDDLLLSALAAGLTVDRAARYAGMSPSTAFRRLRQDDFSARLDELRAANAQTLALALSQAALAAVNALTAILDDPEASVSARVAAGKVLLDHGLRPVPATGADDADPEPAVPLVDAATLRARVFARHRDMRQRDGTGRVPTWRLPPTFPGQPEQ